MLMTIDELAEVLGIKPRVLEADIKDMAWVWEETVEDMELHNPLAALDVLRAMAKAYIRGRNCRMGSYQGLWKHLPTKSAVMRHVMRYASEEIAKSHFIFRSLHDCGLTSVDEFLETARQMSEERNLRQEEKERLEREETKKRTEQKVRDIIEEMRGRKPYDILDEIRRMMDG